MSKHRKGPAPFLPGCALIPARETREGDVICFRATFADYTVDSVDVSPTGQIRHFHGDGTASSAYHPGELLYVRRAKG